MKQPILVMEPGLSIRDIQIALGLTGLEIRPTVCPDIYALAQIVQPPQTNVVPLRRMKS